MDDLSSIEQVQVYLAGEDYVENLKESSGIVSEMLKDVITSDDLIEALMEVNGSVGGGDMKKCLCKFIVLTALNDAQKI